MTVPHIKLNIPILTQLNSIYHISDIHIRKLYRHDEYNSVFRSLYDDLNSRDLSNSIILLSGDIVHTKIDVSNEQYNLLCNFLIAISNIAPTIIIPGNHDGLIKNKNRIDSISPVINAIKRDNIFYLKDTGIYNINGFNLDLIVWSVFDEYDNYPLAIKSTSKYKIGVYHGIINDTPINNKVTLYNRINIADFNGFDIVLLGDIHQPITLQKYNKKNKKPHIRYAGSLIQQDFGESIDNHGYLIWNLSTRTTEFVPINNEYGFYTINVINGKYKLIPKEQLPNKLRINVILTNTSYKKSKEILDIIKLTYNPISIIYSNNNNIKNKIDIISNNINHNICVGNLSDVDYQNKLIDEYIDFVGISVDDSIHDKIKTINSNLITSLSTNENNTVAISRLKSLEFSNLFSYGENNFIDFTQLSGIVGVFAPNKQGKSSLVDIIEYIFYDKCSRATKIADILNKNKNEFHCKVNFEINGKNLFIKRHGKRKSTKRGEEKIEANVEFWEELPSGEIINLTGDQRRSSNNIIREYIGNIDHFELITASLQHRNTNFIDKVQFERKDLLSNFFGLTIYEQLWELANQENKRLNILIKELNKIDLISDLTAKELEINDYNLKLERLDLFLSKLKELKNQYSTNITELYLKKNNIVNNQFDIDAIQDELIDIKWELMTLTDVIKDVYNKKTTIEKLKHDIKNQLYQFNVDYIEKKCIEFEAAKLKLNELETNYNFFKLEYEYEKSKTSKVKELKYDVNCEYCMNNIYIIEYINHQEKLKQYDITDQEYRNNIVELSNVVNQLKDCKVKYDQYLEYKLLLDQISVSHDTISLNIHNLEMTQTVLYTREHQLNQLIDDYYDNIESIEYNKKIDERINELNIKLKKIDDTIEDSSIERADIYTYYLLAENSRELILNNIDKYDALNEQKEAYEYYMNIISRDGIPYYLISKIVPILQNDINDILAQLVEFRIKLNTDGKNIDAYIMYDKKHASWPIELCSGMERFITSVAIRVALNNMANISKFDFLILDEGFGVLDAESITMLPKLFDYLKYIFQFVLVISHLDTMHDMVDMSLDIYKVDNDSIITYS
jgi:DNA repair exonuclease SbcCD ATPase subunit/DNA repair exonuclease SbcCD nuclease subunit